MIEYDLVNGKLAIKPETLTVAVFKEIWDFDGSKSKELASSLLTYVFTMCDDTSRNAFRNLPFNERDAACRHNAFGSKTYKIPDKMVEPIQRAMDWYEYLNGTPVSRLHKASQKSVDRIAIFLDKTEADSFEQVESIMGYLGKVSAVLKGMSESEKAMKGEKEQTRNKQGTTTSLRTKKLI